MVVTPGDGAVLVTEEEAIMDLDVRTRTASDVEAVDIDRFHAEVIPTLLEDRGELATRAFLASGLDRITIRVGSQAWTWQLGSDGSLEVVPGDAGSGAMVDLTAEWFSDIVNDVRSTVALMVAGEAEMVRGNVVHVVAWEPVLRALTDGRPAYEPGLVDFVDRDGSPLALDTIFTLQDDPKDIAHFLSQAGFLHLRGLFDADEMDQLSAEIDRWRAQMTPEDNRAWYARVGDEQVCVRVTNLGT